MILFDYAVLEEFSCIIQMCSGTKQVVTIAELP